LKDGDACLSLNAVPVVFLFSIFRVPKGVYRLGDFKTIDEKPEADE